MKITFLGAAREVTGSCSLLRAGGKKILVDLGMFQGGKFNEDKNQEPLSFSPDDLDAVFVTHAHLDHVGRLPLLTRNGYQGKFYANPATAALAKLIMEDALEVMMYDNRKFGRPILYDSSDIALVVEHFEPVDYHEEVSIGDVKARFYDAGHIFGSAFIEIEAEGKKIVFSGDVGNIEVPILRDTEILPDNIDALICESTYGDRIHETVTERQNLIEKTVVEAIGRGGVLMIPAFSLERTQELIYELNELVDRKKKLPRVPIFLDSPLAINALDVYRKFPQYYDEEARKLFASGDDLFQFPGLTMCATADQSKHINEVRGPKIIIAGAGMMNGGRIVHHALRYLSDPKSTLLIIGYQAHGTLGRDILDGQSPVTVLNEKVQVRCRVKAIGAMSAHADQDKLLDWIGGGRMTPKKVFLNHGEPLASSALVKRLAGDLGVVATVVDRGMEVEI